MSHAEEIIRKYAASEEPIAEFGPWLVADKDAASKEAALAEVWTAIEAVPIAEDPAIREAKFAALIHLLPASSVVPDSSVAAGALSGLARRFFRPVVWMPLAAAAAVALFLVLHRPSGESSVEFVPNNGLNSEQTLISEAFVPKNVEIPEQIARSAENHIPVNIPTVTVLHIDTTDVVKTAPICARTPEKATTRGQNDPVLTTTPDEVAPATIGTPTEPTTKSEGPAPFLPETTRRKTRVTLSLFGSGGMMASAKSTPINIIGGVIYYPSENTRPPLFNPPVFEDRPVEDLGNGTPGGGGSSDNPVNPNPPVGPMLFNGNLESPFTKDSYKSSLPVEKHELPLNFGLMVGCQFAKRVSVETGIVYSYLRSTSQQLHYLGVPVYLKYDILKGQRYATYVSAGGSASRCMAGSRTGEHPIQMAASVSAGAEYVFNRGLGVFGEVSMNRYFDDHSSMETYYSLNPYSPAVKIGARLTIAR